MPQLTIYLLGPPRIELDGKPIHIGRRKLMALLAFLAVERKRHRRERLAAFLAPEFDQVGAQADLRRTLSLLNSVLGKGWLAADREIIRTDPEAAIWLDVDQFRQQLAACDAHTHDHNTEATCSECLTLLTEAAGLYQGDFMAGFSLPDSLPFDEWQQRQTEALQDDLGSVLDRLSACHAAQGEHQRAITAAQHWLELDPLREAAHRRLMELYAQAGRNGAALRQYRSCVRTLEAELGFPPSAETAALYERLRAARLAREDKPTSTPTLSHRRGTLPAFLRQAQDSALDRDAAPIRVERPIFVARESQLAHLHGYLEAALAGQGQVAFVTGGPGRGKTALLREFAQQAMEAHSDLLPGMGMCNAFSGVGDPYYPFREVMAMLTGDVESRWSAGLITREHARRIWTALPSTVHALLDHGPHLIEILVAGSAVLAHVQTLKDCEHRSPTYPAVSTGESLRFSELQEWVRRRRAVAASDIDQSHIFQQVTDTLRALANQHPLLLTLDDLQWVDAGSASLLFHVGRQLAHTGGRVLILGAYRPEEVTLDRPSTSFAQHPERSERTGERGRHPMQKVLSEFRRHFGDVWLDLAATDRAEGRHFVDAYLDSPANPLARNRLEKDFRSALSERTGGHPLFTVELLRALQERGELVRDAHGAWITGPELDWDTLPARVEAVIQERVERLAEEQRDLLTVASVEGEVFTAQVIAQVQGLSEREVLRALSQELGPRRHRLVREAREVPVAGERSFLSRYRFDHALFQAYLYGTLSAGERRLLHGEVAAALDGVYGEHTDPIAPTLAHHYRAAGHLEKAVAYDLRAGDLAREIHADEEAAEHFKSSLELCRRLANRAGEADSLKQLGWVYNDMDNYCEGERCLQEALRIYRDLGDRPIEAQILRNLGWMCVWQSDPIRGEEYLWQSATIYQEIGEPGKQANALGGLGRLYREHMGDFERARACGEEARRLSREAGDFFNEAVGDFIIGVVLHYQSDYSAADAHMQRSVQIMYDKCNLVGNPALCCVHVALNAIALGDYGAAASHLEHSRRTFREVRKNDLDDDAWAQSTLALLNHQMGEDGTARDYATRATAIHRRTGYDYRTATALTRLGHALAALGDTHEAAAAYQEALDLRREMGQRHLAPEPLAGLARVALVQDSPKRARAYVDEILSHLETGSVDGTDEPLRIYLTCYRVLQANADPRAEEVLGTAYNLLQERAARIDDAELRRSYLEKVAAHRELVELYAVRNQSVMA